MTGKNENTKDDAARVQSSQAKAGGDMTASGFPAQAQSGAAKNEHEQDQVTVTGQQEQKSGKGQGGKK